MSPRPVLTIAAGAVLVAAIGYASALRTGPRLAERLDREAAAAIAAIDAPEVDARFTTGWGAPTRHALLTGGEQLGETKRARVARAVAAIDGVGGVFWQDGTVTARSDQPVYEPLHCQEDVEGLLQSRSIRFEEASSALQSASDMLLDEVADALRPCLGAIIAITGHTDTSGTEPGNLALSLDRARAVREALVARGIPRDGLRARGLGSSEPVDGLAPADPANRRIEFSVISVRPLVPTPIDTPGPR